MNHKQKRKLARQLITPQEIKDGVSIWDSVAWKTRTEKKKEQLEKKEAKVAKEKNLTKDAWNLLEENSFPSLSTGVVHTANPDLKIIESPWQKIKKLFKKSK